MDKIQLDDSDYNIFPPIKHTFSLSNLTKLTSNNSNEY